MKRFLKKCCLIIPLILLLIGVNYYVDPGNIFRQGGTEQSIAKFMSEGLNVTNANNFDDRMMRKMLLKRLEVQPDILVLSSSRGGFISSNIFPGQKVLNNFLRGASLEDYVAIYDIIETKNWNPKKIVFTLDPWLLNDQNQAIRWMALEGNYNSMLRKLKLPGAEISPDKDLSGDLKFKELAQLMSFSYFKQACVALLKGGRSIQPTNQRSNKEMTYISDGSMCYDKKRREASVGEVRKLAIKYVNEKPIYSLGGFEQLSRSKILLLEKFIDHIQQKGIEMEFYLPPYHPLVYKYLSNHKEYQQVFLAENYYRELALSKGIICRGSYNPGAYGLTEASFYDGMHSKEQAVEFVFKSSTLNKIINKEKYN